MLGGSVPKLNCVSAGYKRFQQHIFVFVLVSLHSNAIVTNMKIESDDGQCKKFAIYICQELNIFLECKILIHL